MTDTYTTAAGDRLDRICLLHYGTERRGVVEIVLADNPGLASLGIWLPAGVTVRLPEIVLDVSETDTVKLWN